MLDIIARLLLSAGILVGTTYLPMLSQAVAGVGAIAKSAAPTPSSCAAKPAVSNARPPACLG